MAKDEHPRVGSADGSGAMFDRIAGRYDLLNRINSLGQDRAWRRRTIALLDLQPDDRLLDLATGTGDLLLEVGEMAPGVDSVGLDPSARMLEFARGKLVQAGLRDVKLIEGDARALPFERYSFTAVTMAFGIRNVPERASVLSEAYRVLGPGGRVAILELSEPRLGVMSSMARVYIRTVVPLLGRVISGADAYRYLSRSIEAFPAPSDFAEEIRKAGFTEVTYEMFMFGACVLFMGTKEVES